MNEILTNYSIEITIAILAFIILYLLYYIFNKDAQYQKNLRSVASVVEELNREIFYLKKTLKETHKKLENKNRTLSDDEIYSEIERTVYDMVKPLSIAIKQLEESVIAIDNQIDSRIANLESGVKSINIPSSIHANDDEKIISLYKQGVSIETIAKELHISKPEVEFVLKINKIK